jgi:hypothetical protein
VVWDSLCGIPGFFVSILFSARRLGREVDAAF